MIGPKPKSFILELTWCPKLYQQVLIGLFRIFSQQTPSEWTKSVLEIERIKFLNRNPTFC